MIAVLDSGIGGTSVLKELIRLMPGEDFLFYGDTKHIPYGTKTPEEIRSYVFPLAERWFHSGAKALVIACNTATAVCADELRGKYPDKTVIGIEPALKPAALSGEHPSVLCMATPLTLSLGKYETLEKRFSKSAEITPLPCPGLAELIEEGHLDDNVLEEYLTTLFEPFRDRHFDACVLGCTHYPHIRKAIARHLGDGCALIDGGCGTARETKRRLEEKGLLSKGERKGRIVYRNSARSGRTNLLAKQLTEGTGDD